MEEKQIVYVVVDCVDRGEVAGVFTTQEKAAAFIAKHAYNAYMITECVLDDA